MSKLEEQSEELYQKALVAAVASTEGKAKIFTSEELIALGVVGKVEDLMGLVQGLLNDQLIRLLHLDHKVLYALRSRDVAEKLRRLSGDELMVYSHVESSGTNGAWTKNLKIKTGLVQTVINKVIKTLESKTLIKSVKNIKNPTQKSYILSHLDPGEDVRGGPWHTDGELDMEMIGITADMCVRFIESKSWVKGHIKVERHRSISPLPSLSDNPDSGGSAGTKRKRTTDTDDIEDLHLKHGQRSHVKIETQIAHPPGYDNYPTVQSVLAFVQQTGFLKTSASLTQEDIQGLLDVLALDGRIEKVGVSGYRTVKGIKGATDAMKNGYTGGSVADAGEEGEGTGLTQTPCGRCPVYNLCQEGGPVNPQNCEYYELWLKA
ncbi:RNA polymerase Rpc34 [Myriangium duriaei CBS 260.36]|uniref:DNA-directed RNA polymerase III subunit RPC6 n=1 Tax=Myriangium duriaei CBS 260.36 TaxID=1168546 RepID=A0A9P4MLF1_9PEZI|nr:RNA polymerase Rpc34 [Myriangium duriaei CBS 260.36]